MARPCNGWLAQSEKTNSMVRVFPCSHLFVLQRLAPAGVSVARSSPVKHSSILSSPMVTAFDAWREAMVDHAEPMDFESRGANVEDILRLRSESMRVLYPSTRRSGGQPSRAAPGCDSGSARHLELIANRPRLPAEFPFRICRANDSALVWA